MYTDLATSVGVPNSRVGAALWPCSGLAWCFRNGAYLRRLRRLGPSFRREPVTVAIGLSPVSVGHKWLSKRHNAAGGTGQCPTTHTRGRHPAATGDGTPGTQPTALAKVRSWLAPVMALQFPRRRGKPMRPRGICVFTTQRKNGLVLASPLILPCGAL